MRNLLSLPMYDLPEVRWATDALLRRLGALLEEPAATRIEHESDVHSLWESDSLLFTQTCGYPLMTGYAGRLTYVATPHYAAPGCSGPEYCSLVIVREADRGGGIEKFRGRRVAFNGTDSQSGYNALRHLVAPLAAEGRFFGETVQTGGHIASVAAVRESRADIAAIDSVTWALLQKHRPQATAGLSVLTETAAAPGLPYATHRETDERQIERLRAALKALVADAALAEARGALLLNDIEVLPLSRYQRVLEMRDAAAAQNYPDIA